MRLLYLPGDLRAFEPITDWDEVNQLRLGWNTRWSVTLERETSGRPREACQDPCAPACA